MQFSETGGDEDMFCWLMEKGQTFCNLGMGNWPKKKRMPKENFPPPVIVSPIYLASCFLNVTQPDSIPCVLPPPTFLVFSLSALVLLPSALSFPVVRNRNTPLIRTLFPNFHGRRSRGRDVWQALQLNPVIFRYMTGEAPETWKLSLQKYTER